MKSIKEKEEKRLNALIGQAIKKAFLLKLKVSEIDKIIKSYKLYHEKYGIKDQERYNKSLEKLERLKRFAQ